MDKKVKIQQVTIVLLAVLLVVNLFMVTDMKRKLDDVNFNVSNKLQQIESDVKSIRYEIQSITEDIEEETGLITSFDFSYGELDKEKLTVPVRSKIVPKSLREETALHLEFSGRTVEMKKDAASSAFIADFEVGLFGQKDESNVRLVIRNGEFSETVELDWNFAYLHTDFLPSLIVHLIFDDVTYSEKTGIKVEGRLSGFIDDGDIDRFRDIKLIYKINGEVLSEAAVDISNVDMYEISKSFPGYGVGDTLELYIEATDELGFIHESLIKKAEIAEDGVAASETEPIDKGYAIIKDKEGNVLYS